jgi:hypothetical protein
VQRPRRLLFLYDYVDIAYTLFKLLLRIVFKHVILKCLAVDAVLIRRRAPIN